MSIQPSAVRGEGQKLDRSEHAMGRATMPVITLHENELMKQYLLSIYQPDGGTPPPEFLQKVMRDVGALIDETKAAGAWVFNGGLHPPSTATVVRYRDGDVLTTDGPFAEGKEHIGGFLIVQAPDLDAALEWAKKTARATTLPIEVRPFRER